ncbi:hypothetical protein AKJ56_01700 [candidate division MSBL1 archaeon SCGC-AAA382N08]|uniref:Sulfotransferase domain-containing protein n=1 Tax=candidate division MSBL1 archaeon SCGC-AAA382N08 TaxID=1698285 RepID=A0A133VP23_9EURY|nr:hypothetical protein AKJ56_01700 [candidate division MSBL1 archaeon SCGC-AAA382N08]
MVLKNFKIDFAGIGASKCATTWIYECLREHPEICMSRPKGTHYFDGGNKDYRKFFKHCSGEKLKGEFTPTYYMEPGVAKRIKDYNSDIKLIASIRNPVDRVWSHYLHNISLGDGKFEGFEEGKIYSDLLKPGFYYKHLKDYFRLFPRENILILFHQDLKKGPTSFIQVVYDFLGVNFSFVPDTASRRVAPSGFKFTGVGRTIHEGIGKPLSNSFLGRKLKSNPWLKKVFYRFANFYVNDEESNKPEFPKQLQRKVLREYKEDIDNIEQLLNKDLSSWKEL